MSEDYILFPEDKLKMDKARWKRSSSASSSNDLLCIKPNVEDVAKYLTDYWGTYIEMQVGVRDYTAKTIIEDALYGLGAALNDDYRFAQGFDKFKKDLLAYLDA